MRLFPQSIRWRVQLYYTLLLAVIVGALLVAFYQNQREIKYQVVDRDLNRPITQLMPRLVRGRDQPGRGWRGRRVVDDFEMGFEEDLPRGPGPGLGPPRDLGGVSLEEVVAELAAEDIYVMEWNGRGELRYSSPNAPVAERTMPERDEEAGEAGVRKRMDGGYREAIHAGPGRSLLVVGQAIGPLERMLARLRLRLAGIGVAIVGGGFLVGWLLIGRSLKPLGVISDTAHRIAEGDLSSRIAMDQDGSELGVLSGVLNETFAQLEASFEHQVRFTADASHEMRTPIAVIVAKSQFALSRERSVEKYQEALQTCLDSAQHMRSLTDGLLELAKVDAGEFHLIKEAGNLEDLTREVVKMMEPLADEKAVTFRCDLKPVQMSYDGQKMRQALLNLLANSVKYNREGGEVIITLRESQGGATLRIRDTGVGMDAETCAQIFERFYRADKARTRTGKTGTGLGLAITRAIIEAHGGTISVTSEREAGSEFEVTLPG